MKTLYEQAEKLIEELKTAREESASVSMRVAQDEYDLALERARAEVRIVGEAGGDEKAIGANAEARARVFTIALDADEIHKRAVRRVWETRLYARKCEALVLALQDRLDLAMVMLEDGK